MLNARARRHAARVLRRAFVAAVLFSAGLALALGLGAPEPGLAEASYAAAMGVVAWGSVLAIALRSGLGEGDGSRAGTKNGAAERWRLGDAGLGSDAATDPVVLERLELERDLRLSRLTMEDYDLLLRHRLERLTSARCSRLGCSPAELPVVGDRSDPSDRTAPGVPTSEVDSLVGRLEAMT